MAKLSGSWLFLSLLRHPMCLRFHWDSTDFRRRDLQGATPVGAPLDMVCRSSLLLRSAQTLSTTLLGFEFLKQPQHVLSNLLDRPHSSVLARSTTITSSSAFPLAFALALFPGLRPSPSNRQSAAPWASSRGGRRSRPSCPPHTPCTDGGHVHGCFPCHNRPNTHCAETCTPRTRAVGSRSSLALCPSWVPLGSIWTDPAHGPSRCAPQTRRSGPPREPPRTQSSGLGHFNYHRPRSWPCPHGSPDDGGLLDDLDVLGLVDPATGPRSWR